MPSAHACSICQPLGVETFGHLPHIWDRSLPSPGSPPLFTLCQVQGPARFPALGQALVQPLAQRLSSPESYHIPCLSCPEWVLVWSCNRCLNSRRALPCALPSSRFLSASREQLDVSTRQGFGRMTTFLVSRHARPAALVVRLPVRTGGGGERCQKVAATQVSPSKNFPRAEHSVDLCVGVHHSSKHKIAAGLLQELLCFSWLGWMQVTFCLRDAILTLTQ